MSSIQNLHLTVNKLGYATFVDHFLGTPPIHIFISCPELKTTKFSYVWHSLFFIELLQIRYHNKP